MIVITHARIVNDIVPSFGVKLTIKIPREKLEIARRMLKDFFQADRIYLTYTQRV